jgi:hypothetical protein
MGMSEWRGVVNDRWLTVYRLGGPRASALVPGLCRYQVDPMILPYPAGGGLDAICRVVA